jgi:hypothetical protein
MEKSTLRDLIDQSGANGVIRIDDGNGSAGPMWIDWDEEMSELLGDTEMLSVNHNYRAYPDQATTYAQAARHVIPDYAITEMHASAWIVDDDRNYPYQAQNPYRYRLIF